MGNCCRHEKRKHGRKRGLHGKETMDLALRTTMRRRKRKRRLRRRKRVCMRGRNENVNVRGTARKREQIGTVSGHSLVLDALGTATETGIGIVIGVSGTETLRKEETGRERGRERGTVRRLGHALHQLQLHHALHSSITTHDAAPAPQITACRLILYIQSQT